MSEKMVRTATELGQALIEALNLPPNTIWVEIRVSYSEGATVRCGFYPDVSTAQGAVEVLKEFDLVEKVRPAADVCDAASETACLHPLVINGSMNSDSMRMATVHELIGEEA